MTRERSNESAFQKPQGCEGIAVGTGNNAYTHRNESVIRAHQENGCVPPEQAPIAAEVLNISLEDVRTKK